MASPVQVAQQLGGFYYQTFKTNRGQLASLYKDQSVLSWNGEEVKGAAAIATKLTELPFEKVEFNVMNCDAQISNPDIGTIIVLVSGQLSIDDGPGLNFTQAFQLVPEGGSYWIYNDIFRLVLQ
ncbi:nuclear transport factor 2 [Ramicandelaber brevisporus]|nr:nuclear transport factor 2 [Ramicandelaber brevisporus]